MNLVNAAVTVVRVPAELAIGVAKSVVGTAWGLVAGGDEERPPEWADRKDPQERPARPPKPRPSRARRPRNGNGRSATAVAEPPAPPPPAPPEPAHVSEEPELVAEVAEEGAEEGAGAEVRVDEPWPGYDEMTAADIADRLVAEDAEVAAAVQLYEASTKGRTQVLEASSRTLGA